MSVSVKKAVLALLLSMLMLLSGQRTALAAASGDDETDAQWVFLLPSPDQGDECTFFARPVIAGYTPDDETTVQLNLRAGDKSYDVELAPIAGSGGWLASPKYDMSPRLLSDGFTADVSILQGGEAAAETTMDHRMIAAAWPEVKGGSIRLKEDGKAFDLSEWVSVSDSPLFHYTVEGETGCSALLHSDRVEVTANAADAHFSIVVSDPAGNRKVAEIKVGQTKIPVDPKVIVILVVIAAAAVIIGLLLRKKKRKADGDISALTDAICDVEDQINDLKRAIDDAELTWAQFGRAKRTLTDKGQSISSAAAEIGSPEESNAFNNAQMVLDELMQVFHVLNDKLPRREPLTAEERALDVKNYLDAAWRADKLGEAKMVMMQLDDRCEKIRRLTAGMENRLEIKPLLHNIRVQITVSGKSDVWAGYIAGQEAGEEARAIELNHFPLFCGQERASVSDLLGGVQLKVIGDDDQGYQIISDPPALAASKSAEPDSSMRVRYNVPETIAIIAGGRLIGEMTMS